MSDRFANFAPWARDIETCCCCGAPFTVMTKLHEKAHACTGCMLRTLRQFDYTHPREDGAALSDGGGA